MSKGARYIVGGSLSVYLDAGDAIAKRNPRSTITDTSSSVEGAGNPYIYSGFESYYPAIPIYWAPSTGGGYLIGWINDLDNFQASKPTVSPTSVDLGSQVGIAFPRNNTSIRHTVKFKAGNKTVTILNKADSTSTNYRPTLNNFAAEMPDTTSMVGIIEVESFHGDRSLGKKTTNLTIKIPSNIKPTVGLITIEERTPEVLSNFTANTHIQGISTFRAEAASMAPGQGAIITKREWSFDGQAGASTGIRSPVFAPSRKTTGLKVTLKLTDSRGRTATSSSNTFSQLAYNPPVIKNFTPRRVGIQGIQYDANITRSSLNGQNKDRFRIRSKKVINGTWTTLVAWSTKDTSPKSQSNSSAGALKNDGDYILRLEVEDLFHTASFERELTGSIYELLEIVEGRRINLNLPEGLFLNGSEIQSSGEDSNGWWVRYANGLQICGGRVTRNWTWASYGTGSRSNETETVNLPLAFKSVSDYFVDTNMTNPLSYAVEAHAGVNYASSFQLRLSAAHASPTAGSLSVNWGATGRWK